MGFGSFGTNFLTIENIDLKGVSSSRNKDKKVIASHVFLLYAGVIQQPTWHLV